MELITETIAAGQTKQFRKAGAYFEIIDSTAAIDIAFYTPQGGQNNRIKGGLSGLYLDTNFGAFDLTSATAQTVQILVCDAGESGGSRRQPGNVRIIDNSAEKSRAGRQFWNGYTAAFDAGAYRWAHVTAVGGEVAVKRLAVASTVAGALSIYVGSNGGTLYSTGLKYPLTNKYIGAPASTIARIGEGVTAAAIPTSAELPGFIGIGNIYVTANQIAEMTLTTPMVLQAGQMILIGAKALNRDVQIIADVEEI